MITDMPGMITRDDRHRAADRRRRDAACARCAAGIPYGAWWLLHLTAYAGVVLGFAHQIETGDDFVGRPAAAAVWKGMVVAVLAAVAWWRIARPLADAWARRTRVAAATREGGGVSIWLEGDGAGRRGLRGGGFVLVRFLARGLWTVARPYSVVEVGDGDRLRLVVRLRAEHRRGWPACARGRGRSSKGRSATSTGSRSRPGAPVLLVGAGAGITPLRPLAADLAADGHDVVVVHRVDAAEPSSCSATTCARWPTRGAIVLHDLVGDRATLGRRPARRRRPGAARARPRGARRRRLHAARADRAARPRRARARGRPRAPARGGVLAVSGRLLHLGAWVRGARRLGRRGRRPRRRRPGAAARDGRRGAARAGAHDDGHAHGDGRGEGGPRAGGSRARRRSPVARTRPRAAAPARRRAPAPGCERARAPAPAGRRTTARRSRSAPSPAAPQQVDGDAVATRYGTGPGARRAERLADQRRGRARGADRRRRAHAADHRRRACRGCASRSSTRRARRSTASRAPPTPPRATGRACSPRSTWHERARRPRRAGLGHDGVAAPARPRRRAAPATRSSRGCTASTRCSRPSGRTRRCRAGARARSSCDECPAEVHEVLDLAARASARTGGAFDPAWAGGRPDPTGLVKGWAADRAIALARGASTSAASRSTPAGDVRTAGSPGGGRPWRIGIEAPGLRRQARSTSSPGTTCASRPPAPTGAAPTSCAPGGPRAARCRSRSSAATSPTPTPTPRRRSRSATARRDLLRRPRRRRLPLAARPRRRAHPRLGGVARAAPATGRGGGRMTYERRRQVGTGGGRARRRCCSPRSRTLALGGELPHRIGKPDGRERAAGPRTVVEEVEVRRAGAAAGGGSGGGRRAVAVARRRAGDRPARRGTAAVAAGAQREARASAARTAGGARRRRPSRRGPGAAPPETGGYRGFAAATGGRDDRAHARAGRLRRRPRRPAARDGRRDRARWSPSCRRAAPPSAARSRGTPAARSPMRPATASPPRPRRRTRRPAEDEMHGMQGTTAARRIRAGAASGAGRSAPPPRALPPRSAGPTRATRSSCPTPRTAARRPCSIRATARASRSRPSPRSLPPDVRLAGVTRPLPRAGRAHRPRRRHGRVGVGRARARRGDTVRAPRRGRGRRPHDPLHGGRRPAGGGRHLELGTRDAHGRRARRAPAATPPRRPRSPRTARRRPRRRTCCRCARATRAARPGTSRRPSPCRRAASAAS